MITCVIEMTDCAMTQDKADDVRHNTPDSRDVRAEGESVVDSVKEGAQHAKDATVDAAKYIAGRFTAPVSGDEKTDQEQVKAPTTRPH
jgi:hypothetical protein